jgi:hypothetical protein
VESKEVWRATLGGDEGAGVVHDRTH